MEGGAKQYRDDASPERYRSIAYINSETGMDSKPSRVMALLNTANQKMGSYILLFVVSLFLYVWIKRWVLVMWVAGMIQSKKITCTSGFHAKPLSTSSSWSSGL